MSTFRLAALGILAVLAAVYGYYLLSRPQSITPPPQDLVFAQAEVLDDGSIRIEGARFDDPIKLKAKLAEIRKKHPGISITLRGAGTTKMQSLGKAVALLQKSGVSQIGFITEPRNAPDDTPTPAPR